MPYTLKVDGYTFDNPPEDYQKSIRLRNTAVPHQGRALSSYYQSDSYEMRFEARGTLSLSEQEDLDELESLQQLAIDGGEVAVLFDPFFSGYCVLEDQPFRQAENRAEYDFRFRVNTDRLTNTNDYSAHATPTTGNTFEYGDFDFGYDPDSVEQTYERQVESVDNLSGATQFVDEKGLVTGVSLSGNTDGGGQAELWSKAKANALAYLDAEFQNGWALVTDLTVQNNTDAPHYLDGLFEYDVEFHVVKDPASGIGEVTPFIDHDVKNTGTYVSDGESGSETVDNLDLTISAGTGSLGGDYVTWAETTLSLTDNDTNWIYVTDANGDGQGDVLFNNSGFPASAVNLYRVETSNGSVQRIEDVRSRLVGLNDSNAADGSTRFIDQHPYWSVETGVSPDAPNNQETDWPATTVRLALNATNYVYVEDPDTDGDGDVRVNQSGYPSGVVQLWRVATDGTTVTGTTDDRPPELTGPQDSTGSDLVFGDDLTIDDTAISLKKALVMDEDVSPTETVELYTLQTLPDQSLTTSDSTTFQGLFEPSDTIGLGETISFTLDPGQYDTSGNVYEGGRTTVNYE